MVNMGFQNPETAYTGIDLERGIDGSAASEEGSSRFSNGHVVLLRVKDDCSGFREKTMREETVKLASSFSGSLCGLPDGEYVSDKTMASSIGFDHMQKKVDLGTPAKKAEIGMPRKKASERSPKPPRPPKSFSLDAADRKLLEEISRLAKLKQARNERRRALKKMSTSEAESGSSWGVVIVAVFFFLIFMWQVLWGKYLS